MNTLFKALRTLQWFFFEILSLNLFCAAMKRTGLILLSAFGLLIFTQCTEKQTSTGINNAVSLSHPALARQNKALQPYHTAHGVKKKEDTIIVSLLRRLYKGEYDDSTKWIYRAKDKTLNDSFKEFGNEFDTVITSIAHIDTVISGTDTNIFIISATVPSMDGEPLLTHALSPLLEGIVARKTNGTQLTIIQRGMLCMAGSFGEAPEAEIKQIGKNHWGIILHPGFTGQGYTVENMLVYTFIKDRFIKVFETVGDGILSDNDGATYDDSLKSHYYSYNSKISYDNSHSTDFYDILIHTQGTRFNENSNKVEPIDEKKQYRYKGQKYVAIK